MDPAWPDKKSDSVPECGPDNQVMVHIYDLTPTDDLALTLLAAVFSPRFQALWVFHSSIHPQILLLCFFVDPEKYLKGFWWQECWEFLMFLKLSLALSLKFVVAIYVGPRPWCCFYCLFMYLHFYSEYLGKNGAFPLHSWSINILT